MRSNLVIVAVALTVVFSVASCTSIFKLSDGKAVMYSVSNMTLSWIDALRVSFHMGNSHLAEKQGNFYMEVYNR